MRSIFPVFLIAAAPLCFAQTRGWEEGVERAFATGGRAVLRLSTGVYTVVGGEEGKVKVRWSTKNPHQMNEVEVKVEVKGSEVFLKTHGPKDDFRVFIELPKRTHLDARLSVGLLAVSGIEGDKKLDLNIGEMKVDVPDSGVYRSANASVRIGELSAKAFKCNEEGLFNRLRWKGNGAYTFEARVGIGEATFAGPER